MLAGVLNFKDSEKLKENSIYCLVDFSRARASSFSPVFLIFRSLKNLKKTPLGSFSISNLPRMDKGINLHLADVLLIAYLHENTIIFFSC
jgi:hypothetical protein